MPLNTYIIKNFIINLDSLIENSNLKSYYLSRDLNLYNSYLSLSYLQVGA